MGSFLSTPASPQVTTGRLEAGDFGLYEVNNINGKGLGILTTAIHASTEKIAEPHQIAEAFKTHTGKDLELKTFSQEQQNQVLSALIRDIWVTKGWMLAYEVLVNTMPNISLHPRLLEDMKIAVDIYSRIKEGEQKKKTTDLKIHIGDKLTYNSITWVGPKSAGGNAWKASEEYVHASPIPYSTTLADNTNQIY